MSAPAAFAGAKLHHFGISVPDLEDTVARYREKLGFELLYRLEIPGTGAEPSEIPVVSTIHFPYLCPVARPSQEVSRDGDQK